LSSNKAGERRTKKRTKSRSGEKLTVSVKASEGEARAKSSRHRVFSYNAEPDETGILNVKNGETSVRGLGMEDDHLKRLGFEFDRGRRKENMRY
jgi:hypothetical protein